jgi:hypothetical protein
MNYIEAAAIKAFINILFAHFPNQYEWEPVPDGLGADLIIRRASSDPNEWCAVQVKSAKAHDGERMHLSLTKQQGEAGGKYENMVIVAVCIDPALSRPTAEDGFDAVAAAEIKDLFVFQNASEMPSKSLQPFPRRLNSKGTDYGDNRYTPRFDAPERLAVTLQLFADCVDNAPKFTREDTWFGPDLIQKIIKHEHWKEVMNCKALAEIVGFENLSAPLAQNECVDTVACIAGTQVKVSLKTASLNGKGYQLEIGNAPNSQFCDVVLIFYINRVTGERTHVSVLCAKEVYSATTKAFIWSPTQRPHIMKTKISLRYTDARRRLQETIKDIMDQKA